MEALCCFVLLSTGSRVLLIGKDCWARPGGSTRVVLEEVRAEVAVLRLLLLVGRLVSIDVLAYVELEGVGLLLQLAHLGLLLLLLHMRRVRLKGRLVRSLRALDVLLYHDHLVAPVARPFVRCLLHDPMPIVHTEGHRGVHGLERVHVGRLLDRRVAHRQAVLDHVARLASAVGVRIVPARVVGVLVVRCGALHLSALEVDLLAVCLRCASAAPSLSLEDSVDHWLF